MSKPLAKEEKQRRRELRFIKTCEDFFTKSDKIYSGFYDYSKSIYIKASEKIIIICPMHGEFTKTPNKHLMGQGCPKCGNDRTSKKLSKTTDELIEESEGVHGTDRFDYSMTEYRGSHKKLNVKCVEHDLIFSTFPSTHLGRKTSEKIGGCPMCLSEFTSKNLLKDTAHFISASRAIHGDEYDYSLAVYVNNKTKLKIICSKHEVFEMTPCSHFSGSRCPECMKDRQGWSRGKWVNAGASSMYFKMYSLYKVKLYNENECFYKIGITFLDIKTRFSGIKNPYNYEIIEIIESDDGEYIWNLEKELHRQHYEYKYTPRLKFKGRHECFT